MGIQKAFGYLVRCDQEWELQMEDTPGLVDGDGGRISSEGKKTVFIQCEKTLLIVTESHSQGKYGGEFVIHDAKKNGFLFDRAGNQFACPDCFKKLKELGKVAALPANTLQAPK